MKTLNRPRRKVLRLPDYDYSTAGAYFVTICTQDRSCFFEQEAVCAMVQKWWGEIPRKFPSVELDEFVVMPNHVHGILILTDLEAERADLRVGPSDNPSDGHTGSPLSAIIQWFKTMTTNAYIRGVKESGWPPFPGKLWQHSYYDHIIRNNHEYLSIRHYIQENPNNWADDPNNPANPAPRAYAERVEIEL